METESTSFVNFHCNFNFTIRIWFTTCIGFIDAYKQISIYIYNSVHVLLWKILKDKDFSRYVLLQTVVKCKSVQKDDYSVLWSSYEESAYYIEQDEVMSLSIQFHFMWFLTAVRLTELPFSSINLLCHLTGALQVRGALQLNCSELDWIRFDSIRLDWMGLDGD